MLHDLLTRVSKLGERSRNVFGCLRTISDHLLLSSVLATQVLSSRQVAVGQLIGGAVIRGLVVFGGWSDLQPTTGCPELRKVISTFLLEVVVACTEHLVWELWAAGTTGKSY